MVDTSKSYSELTLDEMTSLVREGHFEGRVITFNKKGAREEFPWKPARMLAQNELPYSPNFAILTRWDLESPMKESLDGVILVLGPVLHYELRKAIQC